MRARVTDRTGQALLNVVAQPLVARQLGSLWATGPALGMPLRDRRLVVQVVGAG
jgi:hypothetical protein